MLMDKLIIFVILCITTIYAESTETNMHNMKGLERAGFPNFGDVLESLNPLNYFTYGEVVDSINSEAAHIEDSLKMPMENIDKIKPASINYNDHKKSSSKSESNEYNKPAEHNNKPTAAECEKNLFACTNMYSFCNYEMKTSKIRYATVEQQLDICLKENQVARDCVAKFENHVGRIVKFGDIKYFIHFDSESPSNALDIPTACGVHGFTVAEFSLSLYNLFIQYINLNIGFADGPLTFGARNGGVCIVLTMNAATVTFTSASALCSANSMVMGYVCQVPAICNPYLAATL